MYKLALLFLTYTSASPTKYYYDSRIHNFGNIGFGGHVHSLLAPYATKMIDEKCYNSVNIRQLILSNYNQNFYSVNEQLPKIIDLCCGTGTSTGDNQLGIDTSKAMLNQARNNNNNNNKKTQFIEANAENYQDIFSNSDMKHTINTNEKVEKKSREKFFNNYLNI